MKPRKAGKPSPEKPDSPAANSTPSEPSGAHEAERESKIASGTWLAIDEKALRQIDEEALTRSKGDVALWHHQRALLKGEVRIHCRGNEDWRRWVLVKNLRQYKEAEASVIEAWRKYTVNVWHIPIEQQTDPSAINRAIILDGCRCAKNKEQAAEILKRRPEAIRTFAAAGDVGFFRALGRLLGAPEKTDPEKDAKKYDYAHAMLSHWLTNFLWLMSEINAAGSLASWRGHRSKTAAQSDSELRHFKEAKRVYKLRSHKPSLIDHIEPDGSLILTAQGRSLFP